jgi:hypothetical protein
MRNTDLSPKQGVVGRVITVYVVTAILLGIFQSWFLRILVPWFEDLRYKSVRLDGEWSGTNDTQNFDVSYRLRLKQTANRVRGVLKIVKKEQEHRTE